jgi:hypothetical protein
MTRKYDIPSKIELDGEAADQVAIHSLKYFYNYLVDELDEFVLHQKGHPDDYERNLRLREAFELVLDFYGHSLYNKSIAREKADG